MKISRRDLIAVLGGIGGVWILKKIYHPIKYFMFKPDASQVVLNRETPKFASNSKGKVGVVRGTDIKKMIEESINLIGGVEQFAFDGKEVLVKPNINSDDPFPATTNPEVVGSVVQFLYDAGASNVLVGDMSNPSYLPTIKTMQKLGIKRAAEDAGAEVVSFDDDEWFSVRPEKAEYFLEFLVPKTVFKAEKLVSLPVIKTHSIATYTMSLKNFVGAIHPNSRMALHRSDDIEEMIAEINLAVHPDLVIMDGTKSMVAGGPMEGSVKDTGMILTSSDRIAIDIVGLGVVKFFGEWKRVADIGLWEQRQIKRAAELGLGTTKASEIDLKWKAMDDKDHEGLHQLMTSVSNYIDET
ncbi:MAG: DUF362 domain-containing protein [Candidatus Hydrothermarchaeales archaeon]